MVHQEAIRIHKQQGPILIQTAFHQELLFRNSQCTEHHQLVIRSRDHRRPVLMQAPDKVTILLRLANRLLTVHPADRSRIHPCSQLTVLHKVRNLRMALLLLQDILQCRMRNLVPRTVILQLDIQLQDHRHLTRTASIAHLGHRNSSTLDTNNRATLRINHHHNFYL